MRGATSRLGLLIKSRGADTALQEHLMKATGKIVLAIGFVAIAATGATAQTQETKTTTETKTEIKGGKGPTRYALVTKQDLSQNLGHRVEIKGKAVTDGHGTVSVESKTKTEVGDAPDKKTTTKTAGTNGVLDMPFLSVTTIESRSSSCN
jgi:hypothetical protein